MWYESTGQMKAWLRDASLATLLWGKSSNALREDSVPVVRYVVAPQPIILTPLTVLTKHRRSARRWTMVPFGIACIFLALEDSHAGSKTGLGDSVGVWWARSRSSVWARMGRSKGTEPSAIYLLCHIYFLHAFNVSRLRAGETEDAQFA